MSVAGRPSWPRRVVVAPIVAYRRFISPLKPAPTCRFHPTCSAYAVEAVHVHGVFRGLAMATWRLLRCHPYHPGGFDPVPPRSRAAAATPATSGPAPEEP
ncbi:MAG: membrane protein insertion efficiency factor YidD [bacterium]|nr:membrane protein insertion efficiency factor YidD [bacterium]